MIEKIQQQILLERQEKFCKLLREGLTLHAACAKVGIPFVIYRQVMATGQQRTTGACHHFFEEVSRRMKKGGL